ncbi:MAG: hypothetical protein EHM18_11960, partial [Acidobacteria bacterium]
RFVDDLLKYALSTYPIEVVVSVGAGLDARPWRIDLPASLRWVEVDFQEILDYKDSVIGSETPKCRVERLTVDLNQAEDRHRIYSSVGDDPALMILEGILMYLPGNTVTALTAEWAAIRGPRYCLVDITSSEFTRRSRVSQLVAHVSSTTGLSGEQIYGLLEEKGWVTLERRSYVHDILKIAGARILKIMQAQAAAGRQAAPPLSDISGVYLIGQGAASS